MTTGEQPKPSLDPAKLAELAAQFADLNGAAWIAARDNAIQKHGIARPDLELMRNHVRAERKEASKRDKAVRNGVNGDYQSSEADGYISFGGFEMSERGLFVAPEDSPEKRAKLCGAIKIDCQTEDGAGNAWGVHLRWSDDRGNSHSWVMPRHMCVGDATLVLKRLVDSGLYVSPNRRNQEALLTYLQSVRTDRISRCVARVGWSDDAYVTEDRVYSGDDGGDVVFQSDSPSSMPWERAGSLNDWHNQVARYAEGNSRLALAIAAAFAGPLLKPAGESSFGIHFYGASSIGKTTIVSAAASVIGVTPQSWRTTDNAAEGWAALSNDAMLVLDEISQADAKAADALAYMLANGKGKARANRSGLPRKIAEWRTVFLSTGEMKLEEKLSEAGKRAKAGQGVRFLEIPADAEKGHGIFDTLHDKQSGAELSRHLTRASAAYRGMAMDRFLSECVRVADLPGDVKALQAAWVAKALEGMTGVDGQVQRVAGHFGLIAAAGELAISFSALPWKPGAARNAALACFKAWTLQRGGTGQWEIEQGIAHVREIVIADGAARFEDLSPPEPIKNSMGEVINHRTRPPVRDRLGWRRRADDGSWQYLVAAGAWGKELCAGFPAERIAKALNDRGALLPGRDRLTQTISIGDGQKPRCYVLTSAILEGEGGKIGDSGPDGEG